ncbi:RNA polymerase sigma factor [Phenylobacterium immobile]|uniref:RNA polymerase sigma factor n=1 Tax=Phenylobacterium immobile TaxID=21 RepID=UPI000A7F170E|nr:sigma-70 family RNA polymerase sigma factor [Phenylobacterium immobile]
MALGQMLKKARNVVARRGVARDDIDDVVQEAFARLEAYERIHSVRSKEAFLVRAAVNISKDEARRRRNAPFVFDASQVTEIADGAPTPEEVLRGRERLRRAKAGVAQLDPVTRRCLLAQRLEGATYAELAKAEGISVAAAEKRVARALVFPTNWLDGW